MVYYKIILISQFAGETVSDDDDNTVTNLLIGRVPLLSRWHTSLIKRLAYESSVPGIQIAPHRTRT